MPGQKFQFNPVESASGSQGVLDKKVSVSISLKSVVFVLVIVALLAGSFLAGRYVFPSTAPLGKTGIFAAIIANNFGGSDSIEAEVVPENAKESVEAAPVEVTEESAETTEAVVEEVAAEEVAEGATDEIAAESTEAASEAVVTTYSNVKLDFTRTPVFKWNEEQGFGTIRTIYYTLVNGETGTIKPTEFKIFIEGYPPTERTLIVEVPHNTAEVAAGKTIQNAFDKIVAYSSSVTDPANIKVTLELYDENSKLVAKAEKEFNLKG